MAFHDSDPERRNLIVTSLAFIAYFFSGGQLASDTVRLQVINVRFEHPEILAVMAWLTLFWFAYRYWLKHPGAFVKNLNEELKSWANKDYLRKAISTLIGEIIPNDETRGQHVHSIFWKERSLLVRCILAESVKRSKGGQISGYTNVSHGPAPRDYDLLDLKSGLKSNLAGIRVLVETFYAKPSFSSFAVPYLLFSLALIGGLISIAI